MGFHIAYAAFRNIEKAELLERLGLRDTGETDPYHESPFSGGELSSGWYLIWSNDLMWGADEEKFARLSVNCDVLVAIAEETSMTFVASGFSAGRKVWSVVHDAQHSPRHLESEGEMPPSFEEIRQRIAVLQNKENDADPYSVDYYASIPPEVFASVTQFKYDEMSSSGEEVNFTVLEKL